MSNVVRWHLAVRNGAATVYYPEVQVLENRNVKSPVSRELQGLLDVAFFDRAASTCIPSNTTSVTRRRWTMVDISASYSEAFENKGPKRLALEPFMIFMSVVTLMTFAISAVLRSASSGYTRLRQASTHTSNIPAAHRFRSEKQSLNHINHANPFLKIFEITRSNQYQYFVFKVFSFILRLYACFEIPRGDSLRSGW